MHGFCRREWEAVAGNDLIDHTYNIIGSIGCINFYCAVLHVYGDAYSMGNAHGQLLKEQINTIIPGFYQHVQQEIENEIDFLPKEISEFIAKYGLDGALDLTYELTKDYIPKYFIEEIQGLANGSQMDYKLLLRAHMLPELVKVSFMEVKTSCNDGTYQMSHIVYKLGMASYGIRMRLPCILYQYDRLWCI